MVLFGVASTFLLISRAFELGHLTVKKNYTIVVQSRFTRKSLFHVKVQPSLPHHHSVAVSIESYAYPGYYLQENNGSAVLLHGNSRVLPTAKSMRNAKNTPGPSPSLQVGKEIPVFFLRRGKFYHQPSDSYLSVNAPTGQVRFVARSAIKAGSVTEDKTRFVRLKADRKSLRSLVCNERPLSMGSSKQRIGNSTSGNNI